MDHPTLQNGMLIHNSMISRYNVEEYIKPESEQFQDAQMARVTSKKKHHKEDFSASKLDDLELDQIEFIEDTIQNPELLKSLLQPKQEEAAVPTAPKLSRFEQIQEERKKLPIYQRKNEIIEAVKNHQILIVVAETGSGKTTQIPQYLHDAGYEVLFLFIF